MYLNLILSKNPINNIVYVLQNIIHTVRFLLATQHCCLRTLGSAPTKFDIWNRHINGFDNLFRSQCCKLCFLHFRKRLQTILCTVPPCTNVKNELMISRFQSRCVFFERFACNVFGTKDYERNMHFFLSQQVDDWRSSLIRLLQNW